MRKRGGGGEHWSRNPTVMDSKVVACFEYCVYDFSLIG